MGLCSSSEQPSVKNTAAVNSAPRGGGGGGGGRAGGEPGFDNIAPAQQEQKTVAAPDPEDQGVIVLDKSDAHLANNEDDGGALEVYLDNEGKPLVQSRQASEGEIITHRRPSMDLDNVPEDVFEDIDAGEMKIGQAIGSGSFGKVSHGHYKGYHVAVKQVFVPRKQSQRSEVFKDFKKEVALLGSFDHPNILKFCGSLLDRRNNRLWILTELMAGSVGTLLKMIKHSRGSHSMSWRLVMDIARDATAGLTYLHKTMSPAVIHRDLKAENLLLDEDFRCKLADFGLARAFDRPGATMTICGTPSWIAPEVFAGKHYDESVDIYSLSVVLWELVCREKPYRRVEPARIAQKVVIGGLRPHLPPHLPPTLKTLLPRMWDADPSKRPDITEVATELEKARSEVNLLSGVDPKKHWHPPERG